MRNSWDLFKIPCNCASNYEAGVNDVRKEMEVLVIKKGNANDEFRKGWNSCLIALSKNIRIENVKIKQTKNKTECSAAW